MPSSISIELESFLKLPTHQVADLVRAAGPQVCVLPLNGSRRWFAMEHWDQRQEYVPIAAHEYIRLFQLLYDHGLDTILSPVFGSELLHRGEEYVAETLGSLTLLESDPFLHFYESADARVAFYGDVSPALEHTGYNHLNEVVSRITDKTKNNRHLRLFYGLFANDATETIARFSIDYFQKTGLIPHRRELVTAYYGEYVDPVTVFIGFDKPNVFDYPLLSLGEEDLYFTIAPSPYLDEKALRIILYDHLYTRPVEEPDWFSMEEIERERLRKYYRTNRYTILGIGNLDQNVWIASTKKGQDEALLT